jgi:hypothetical protein
VTRPREQSTGDHAYRIRARMTGAGLAMTIPVDLVRLFDIQVGDTMLVVPIEDGFVVSKEGNGGNDE